MKKKSFIAPSILSADLGNLRQEVKDIEAAGADSIHVDIMDGNFVPNISFGPWILDVIRSVSRLPLDCHLMVNRPQDWIPLVASAGADSITVHVESTTHIHRHIETIKKLGKKAGVSFNPGSPVSLIEELLDWVDRVQVMSVEPGFSGQSFIPNALKKIRQLNELRGERNFLVEIDGGVNDQNIKAISEAGADIFVLGSFIFSHPDRKACIASLKDELV